MVGEVFCGLDSLDGRLVRNEWQRLWEGGLKPCGEEW